MLDLSLNAQAVLLGLLEGATEYLPVSSTGHLLLADALLDFQGPPGHVFDIVIQLGAILAIVLLYFKKLWSVLIGLPKDEGARHFVIAVLLAFLPAMVIGAFAHDFIKTVLFNPTVVAIALIVGGFAILLIEKIAPPAQTTSIETMTPKTALKIGLAQCLAMIPGVSRSGATIMGSLMFGVERKTAAEFSFFLAIPTMVGATAYDLYKSRNALTDGDALLIAIGFTAAFVGALAVVKPFVAFISRKGFGPFAWYRIVLGVVALAALYL